MKIKIAFLFLLAMLLGFAVTNHNHGSMNDTCFCVAKAAAEITEQKNINPENSTSSSSYKVTFIELGSVKCIPCRMMQPIMDEIEKEYPDVKVVFYDVWTFEGREYGQRYKVRVIPTQVFLDEEGNEYFRHEGFFPKEELEKVLMRGGVSKKEK